MKRLIIFLILPFIIISCTKDKNEKKMVKVGLTKPLTSKFSPLKEADIVISKNGELLPTGEIVDTIGNPITFNIEGYFHFYVILEDRGGVASRDIYEIIRNQPIYFSFKGNLFLNEKDSVNFPGQPLKIIDWALLALTDSNLVDSKIITSQNVLVLDSGILINPEGTPIYFSNNGKYFISLITKSYTITTTEKIPLTSGYQLNNFFQ